MRSMDAWMDHEESLIDSVPVPPFIWGDLLYVVRPGQLSGNPLGTIRPTPPLLLFQFVKVAHGSIQQAILAHTIFPIFFLFYNLCFINFLPIGFAPTGKYTEYRQKN